jgi:hypothetical protein
MQIQARKFNSLEEALRVSGMAKCMCGRGLKVHQIFGRYLLGCIKNINHDGISLEVEQ